MKILGGALREKTRQENLKRLRQLEDAKKKIRADDPSVFDINNEIKTINSKLSPKIKPVPVQNVAPPDNVSDEEYDEYFDQQNSTVQNEPFGQDLNNRQEQGIDQKRRVANEVLRNEPSPSSTPPDSPQAQATAKPKEDTSREVLKPTATPRGGFARRFKRNGQGVGKAATTAGGEAGAGGAVKQGAKQLGSQAAKAVKKLAAQAAKRIIQAIIAGGPWVWAIVGIGIVVIIILFVVGLSYMGTVNSSLPSSTGGTPIVKVEPKEDGPALQNLLKLGGDKTVADQVVDETTSAMKKSLLETSDLEEVKNNLALTKQINTAIGSLAILEGSKTQDSAKTFLTDLGGVYNLMEGALPVWTTSVGPTRLPIAGTVTIFNNELHGNSFLRADAVPNHNVYIRNSNNQDKCDAVDIGVTTGEAIYPIFGGIVKDVSTDGDGVEGKKIIITSNDGKYTALYAHIAVPTKEKDAAISTTEPLGVAKTNNIQIEVFYTENNENTCLVTNHADMIDHALASRRHQDWGGYLWDRIVKTFNIK